MTLEGRERIEDDVMMVVTVKLTAPGVYMAQVLVEPDLAPSHHMSCLFVALKQVLDGVGLKEASHGFGG